MIADNSPSGPSSSKHSSPRQGLGDLTSTTLAALLDHILIRIKLFQFEAKEIRGELLVKLFVLLTAFLFFAIGYVTLLAGSVSLLIIHFQWPWPKAVLGLGAIHVFVAFILLIIAKKSLSQAPFRDTIQEFEKDRQWLENKHHRD